MKNKISKPPVVGKIILSLIINHSHPDSLLGDLEEIYHEIFREKGVMCAKLWYWWQIVTTFPSFINNSIYWGTVMLKNYLKIALRNLLKQKVYSFINIAGLTIGIVCFILIALFVQDELSYERYHEKADRIYRVTVRLILFDNEQNLATACAPMAAGLVAEFPEVEASTRLINFGNPLVKYNNKGYSEERWFYADSSFFDVFTVPFIQGNPKTALTEPYNVVLTRSMARKYFGEKNPLGKTLNINNRRDYQITGVIEDVPHNSHVHYDFLVSLTSINDSRSQNWIGNNNYHTYFVLREGSSHREFEAKLQTLIKKHVYPSQVRIQ